MIALDAMGGDFAPKEAVLGAIRAAKNGVPVCLFGDEKKLIPLLCAADPKWEKLPLSLVHCSQVVAMDAQPTKAIINYKDSSLVKAIQSVADKKNSAIVSAGNSGAVLVAGTLIIGRSSHVLRPALGQFVPTRTGSIFCVDLGANVDCKPEFLEQFAFMGAVYVRMVTGMSSPRVGLLSNGEEPYKGSALIKETYDRLTKSTLNFIGNIQSRDMFDDKADVLVCDGFAGNILLKGIQGTAHLINHWLSRESQRSWIHYLYFMMGYSIFKRLKARADYAKKGGALLLGVNHPIVIAHGCSQAAAIERALHFAHQIVEEQFVPLFNTQFSAMVNNNPTVILPISQQLRTFFDLSSKS